MSLTNVARFLPETAARVPEHAAVRIPRGPAGAEIIRARLNLLQGEALPRLIRYEELSFRELEDLSNGAALYFSENGLKRGMRVLLMVKPGRDLILSVFALFKLGAVPVVIDPGMGLKNFRRCVARTQPEGLVGIGLAQMVSRVFRKDFGSVRHRVKVGGGGFGKAVKNRASPEFEIAETRENDLAAVLFTSGSTGAPKGVCYEHGIFEAQVRLIRERYGIEPGEVDLPMLPVFALFNPALGMTTVVPEMNPSRPATVDPAKIVQAIRQNEVTNSFGSPVLWNKIGRYCEQKAITLPSLRRILMAGAPVSPALIELYRKIAPQAEVHTPYGATECLPVTSIAGREVLEETRRMADEGKGTCVGRTLPEMAVRIIGVSDDTIQDFKEAPRLPQGQIGEIVVSGPVVTRAYDQLPEETAKAKILETDGTVWHRIGDLGYLDASGRLWFCGRKAERVETPSGTLYTDPCEAIFNQHPRVFRSALIGLGQRPHQIPAMVIEPEPGEFPKTNESRGQFADELRKLSKAQAHTAAIDRFFFKAQFPVDVRHNAKIHRLTLTREFGEQ